MLLQAAAAPDNGALPILTRDPAANRFDNLATIDTVTGLDAWRSGWIEKQIARRRASEWAKGIDAAKLRSGLAAGQ
jgi:hypothetical protein